MTPRDAVTAPPMTTPQARWAALQTRRGRGFSMIEMLVTIAVFTVLMGAMMTFISSMQERYTGEQRLGGDGDAAGG